MVFDAAWLPAGADPLTTFPRVQSSRVDVLDRRDVVLGVLDGVDGWSVDHSVGAVLSASGTLDLTDVGQGIDWLTARFQPWRRVEAAGQVVEWPLGVFCGSMPKTAYTDLGRSWRVDLMGKLVVLDRSRVRTWFSLPAGTVATDAVRDVIAATGETAIAVTDSDETLTAGLVWEPGTSRLRIVNDLLDAIGYFSLRADRYGRFVADPYVRPQDRATVREFVRGPAGLHSPAFTRTSDLEVPNVVILVSASTGDTEALVSVSSNDNPADPFSTVNRGEIAVTETGVEATSQEVLDAQAYRRRVDLARVSATDDITAAPVPLDLHDALRFADQDIDTRVTVQRWSESSDSDLMALTLQEVP